MSIPKYFFAAMLSLAACAGFGQDVQSALKQVAQLNSKVRNFKADVEVHDRQGSEELVATSTLVISKQHGWKKVDRGGTDGGHQIFNDFNTSYEYFPDAKKAFKFTAESAEVAEGFKRPATELTPLNVLDPKSIKLMGKESFDGIPVYHFEGTTTTQFMAQGKPVTTRIETWISTEDGLPRKSVEFTPEGTGTTIYRNVQTNIDLSPKDFKFEVPEGVEVIDVNAEMKKQREQRPAGRPGSRPPAGASPRQ